MLRTWKQKAEMVRILVVVGHVNSLNSLEFLIHMHSSWKSGTVN